MSDIICPICGFKTENLCMPHIKLHGYKDSKSFKEEFGLKYLKSNRLRLKQSKFMKKNSNTKGRKRTKEEIELISKNRAGKGIGHFR